ncbi:DDE-type integrase/transposase/recombinase [Leadbetterella byssophila]|uniref:DDE-type integrase/transposase/recombinase n=1 Tax=Leadbetterella byssophila TaxID=316068 RepID=UPI0039A05995
MKRNSLKRTGRNWVKDLVHREFSFLEFDIKYVYVHGTRTNAQVLTILDVYSRWQLGQYFAYSIKSEDVVKLFEHVFTSYPMPQNFIVRNDNGSQFEALLVQEYLRKKGVTQEFTKPNTPEQNARGRLVILRLTIPSWKARFVKELNLKIYNILNK